MPATTNRVPRGMNSIRWRPGRLQLDCTGILAVLLQAADSVGMRGTVALIGGAPAGAQFSLDHLTTLWGKKVVGILGGEGRTRC